MIKLMSTNMQVQCR